MCHCGVVRAVERAVNLISFVLMAVPDRTVASLLNVSSM